MRVKKWYWIVTIFSIGVVVLLLMTCPGENAVPDPGFLPAETPVPANNSLSFTGRPCTSAEEYRAASERTGSWVGVILVNESMTDSEIFSLLEPYNLPNPEKTRIYDARDIGYYVLINESQRKSNLTNDLLLDKIPGMRLSSDMYSFVEPVNKSIDGKTAIPVILLYGSKNDIASIKTNLARNNITLNQARIVALGDIEPPSGREIREKRLFDLNRDPKVLFAYKEYLQADVC
jgi:hypothetical protein